ncbi:MAG: DUF2177 family protein [Myxococcales bacterium]|nr:DUF2177 family protein [Myxococcales bacterium]
MQDRLTGVKEPAKGPSLRSLTKARLPHRALLTAGVVSAIAFSALDLLWLGVIARDFYDMHLGPLKATPINGAAAALFYLMYIGMIVVHGVRRATSTKDALRRGFELGFATYATYELTNWAVIHHWPGILVLPDVLWGVVLTGCSAWAGRKVFERLHEGVEP